MARAARLRTKIMGIVLLLTVLMAMALAMAGGHGVREVLRAELQNRALAIATDVAGRSVEPILTGNLYELFQTVRQPASNHPDVRYVFVLSPTGEVLAHTFGEQGVPRALLQVNAPANGDAHLLPLRTLEGIVWDAAAPVLDGRAGVVRVGLTEQRIRQALHRLFLGMAAVAGLLTVAGLGMAAFLAGVLVRPVEEMAEVARRIAQGELGARVRVEGADEVGQLGRAFNGMASSLQQLMARLQENQQARQELLHKLMSAQEEERRRVARELHDELGQRLTSLAVGLGELEEEARNAQLEGRAAELRQLATTTLEQARELALQLRPSLLDDLGLIPALRRLASEWERRHGIQIEVMAIGADEPRLPPEIETAIYRIVQEALTNAIRHSGAGSVSVLVRRAERNGVATVEAVVEDDGHGFDVEEALRRSRLGASMGLSGMQERARLLGGDVIWESGEHGTTVYVRIPLDTTNLDSKGAGHSGGAFHPVAPGR